MNEEQAQEMIELLRQAVKELGEIKSALKMAQASQGRQMQALLRPDDKRQQR